jgi:hypothetical protein
MHDACHAVVERESDEQSVPYPIYPSSFIIRHDLIRWIGRPSSVAGTILIADQHLISPYLTDSLLCSLLPSTVYSIDLMILSSLLVQIRSSEVDGCCCHLG